jgi:hypothetical protein
MKRVVRIWEDPQLKTAIAVTETTKVEEFLQNIAKKLGVLSSSLSLLLLPIPSGPAIDSSGN